MLSLIKRFVPFAVLIFALLTLPPLWVGAHVATDIISTVSSTGRGLESFRIFDIERRMSFRIPVPFRSTADVMLSPTDPRKAYLWDTETDLVSREMQFVLYEFDLISGALLPVYNAAVEPDTAYQGIPRRSPDGQTTAIVSGERLFLVSAESGESQVFELPDASRIIPQWSADGQRLLLRPYTRRNQPVRILDVASGTFDPITEGIEADTAEWACDESWLIYRTRQGYESQISRGYALDLTSGQTYSLDDDPLLRHASVRWLWMPDCRNIVVEAAIPYGMGTAVRTSENPLYVYDVETQTARLIDYAADGIGWIPHENALLYVAHGQADKLDSALYKLVMTPDAQPERLGDFVIARSQVLWSDDYQRGLLLARTQPGSWQGRLTLVDLTVNKFVYLTPPDEVVRDFALWE